MTVRLALRVTDDSGQTLQYAIDRTNASPDDHGWVVQAVDLSKPSGKWGGANTGVLTGRIVSMSLMVDHGAATGVIGTAYFRDIEALTLSLGALLPVLPQPALNIATPVFSEGSEFPGAKGSLRVVAAQTGDAVQRLSYDFSTAGRYVGSIMTLATPVEGAYVRFRLRAPSQNKISLRVTDSSNQILQFLIDRSNAPVDAMGWTTHTVRLANPTVYWGGANTGQVQGAIKTLSIVTDKSTSGVLAGAIYLRDVDVLNHAPSPSDLLASEAPATFSVAALYSNTTGQNKLVTGPATASGDRTQTITYDFTQSTAYLGVRFQLSTMVAANTMRFLMKAPAGLQVGVRFIDESGQVFQARLVKPVGVLDDNGFVQYAVKLNQGEIHWGGTNTGIVQGRIREVHLAIDESINHELNQVSTGDIVVRQFQFTNENDQLELNPDAATQAGLRTKGTDPTKVMGVVVSGDQTRDVDEAAAAGFKFVRMDMNWAGVEHTKGVYDFSSYETKITRILSKGMTPLLILAYNNPLYLANAVDATAGHSGIADASNRAAFAEFARRAALYYKGRGVLFEIWNEPNGRGFWLPGPDADGFADALAAAAQAIRTVDPTCTVLSGGLADSAELTYLKRLGQRGVLNGVSGVGYHPYTQASPEIQASYTMARRGLLKQTNVTPGLWNTEVGVSSSWYGNLDGTQDANRLSQAVIVSRNVLSSWALNDPLHVVYRLRDYGTTAAERDPANIYYTPYSATNKEHNFGLLATDYTPKPARKAIAQLFAAASGRQYQGMVTGTPSAIQAMKFVGAAKETVFVAWSGTPSFQGGVTVLNRCNSRLDLAGNAVASSSCVTDVVGNPVTCTSISNNSRMICPVSTDKGPIFIRMSQ
ncbi:MAG: cellulase family glycosylhydrolase [Aquabacterium sp.]